MHNIVFPKQDNISFKLVQYLFFDCMYEYKVRNLYKTNSVSIEANVLITNENTKIKGGSIIKNNKRWQSKQLIQRFTYC